MDRRDIDDRLRELHDETDRCVAPLALLHADRLQCRRGCSDCCRDGITVFEIEAQRIRRHHPGLLADGAPHPLGACAFLDDTGACRIYEHRPYVCRTQGLPLRWLDTDDANETVEYRDICPLNELPGMPLENLAADACWTVGPHEAALATLQHELDGGALRRVALRELFTAAASKPRATHA